MRHANESGRVPAGRPTDGEDRPPLRFVGFLADPEVMAALESIEDHIGDVRGKQSIAIRQSIIAYAASLRSPTR